MVEKDRIASKHQIETLKARNAWLLTVNTLVENHNKTLHNENDKLREQLENHKRNQSLSDRWAQGVVE